MQISARNQIQGILEYIERGKVSSSVYVRLKSGYTLVSVITNGAIDNLNLQLEDEVVAIFKSSSVLLTKDLSLSISARNKFQGTITDINVGEINSEILINIGNGNTIASVITSNSTENLDLKIGSGVSAIIKSSDVMIGK